MAGKKRTDNKGRILRDGERQRSDGKYEYRYDYAGQRRSVYSWKLVPTDRTPAGKRDDLSLREKEKAIERDADDGIDTARAAKMPFNSLFQMYLSTKGKIKDKSREKYKQLWVLHIESASLGQMPISAIKKIHIQKFYSSLSQGGYADATIRMYHNNLIMPALEFAVDNDLIRKNPAKGCLEGYKGIRKREALTRREQQVFLDFVKSNSSYRVYLPMILVMIGTACRIGEVCGLTWSDVDMKGRTVNINHQLSYEKVNGQAAYYITTPKTESGNRVLPMTDQVYRAFAEQKKLNRTLGKNGFYEVDGYRNFVFLDANSRPFTVSLFNAALGRMVKRYNEIETEAARREKRELVLLPHISNHILRHTGCTRMAESGMDPKVLQTIMGHSDIAVTMRIYNHVDQERIEREMKKMEYAI